MRTKGTVKKILIGIAAIVMTGALSDTHVQAKEITYDNFDYVWYARQHPELVEILGLDKDALYQFYENTGKNAGWEARACISSLLNARNFDHIRYAAENPDVAAVMGTSAASLYNHYKNFGYAEGRAAYSTDEEINAAMEIYRIAESITEPEMSEREKVKAVHDYMCIHVAYDYDNYLNDTIPYESYSPVGVVRGTAVCQGYAEAFQIFMDALGIECEVVLGTANGGGHAWNQVKVDGKWYNMDVTWDDPVPDKPGVVRSYEYYLIGNDMMHLDHTPDDPSSVHDC